MYTTYTTYYHHDKCVIQCVIYRVLGSDVRPLLQEEGAGQGLTAVGRRVEGGLLILQQQREVG